MPRTEHPLYGLAGCPTRTEKDQQRAEAGVDAWIKPDAEPLSQILRFLDFQNVRFSDFQTGTLCIVKFLNCQIVRMSYFQMYDCRIADARIKVDLELLPKMRNTFPRVVSLSLYTQH